MSSSDGDLVCRISPPGRRTCGGSTVQSTMVDSTPTGHGPPSSTKSTSSPRSARTCVGSGRADAAESVGRWRGQPAAELAPTTAASADGPALVRRPSIVRRSPRRSLAHRVARAVSMDRASRRSASTAADGGIVAAHSASSSAPAMWTISGWFAGRPFTANTRRTASGFEASAASPYTVSVGMATSPPARKTASARSTSLTVERRRGTRGSRR